MTSRGSKPIIGSFLIYFALAADIRDRKSSGHTSYELLSPQLPEGMYPAMNGNLETIMNKGDMKWSVGWLSMIRGDGSRKLPSTVARPQ